MKKVNISQLSPNDIRILEEKDGKFFFVGEALTLDYECEDGLKVISNKLVNKHFTFINIWAYYFYIMKNSFN